MFAIARIGTKKTLENVVKGVGAVISQLPEDTIMKAVSSAINYISDTSNVQFSGSVPTTDHHIAGDFQG